MADGEQKWIIYFREAQKGLVLNRTNASTLEFLYGSDSDVWLGKPVVLFTEMTSYMGKPCLGIRMRGTASIMQPAPAVVQAPLGNAPVVEQTETQPMGPGEKAFAATPPPGNGPGGDPKDDIPF